MCTTAAKASPPPPLLLLLLPRPPLLLPPLPRLLLLLGCSLPTHAKPVAAIIMYVCLSLSPPTEAPADHGEVWKGATHAGGGHAG